MASNEVIQLFLSLGIILIVAKAAGYISRRAGQPAVLGELLVGILLGPSLINLLGWPVYTDQHLGKTIQQFADIGVLFLLFDAGLEIHLDELRRVGHVAFYSGALGQFASILLVLPLALVFGYAANTAAFVAMMLAPTSVSISAQALNELGVLRTRDGIALLGAAVIDDLLAILLISLLIAVSMSTDGLGQVVIVAVRLILFIGIALPVGWVVLPRLATLIFDMPISSGTLALAIAATLLFGWAAESLGGMASVTGAFIAGLCLGRTQGEVKRTIQDGIRTFNYGLFVPVFFVSIGLSTNLGALGWQSIPFALLLLALAILGKILGCGLGARLGGFDHRSALRVAIGMIPRGEVGLIIGALGQHYGMIPPTVFPAVVLVILATGIVTPPLVRWIFHRSEPSPAVALS